MSVSLTVKKREAFFFKEGADHAPLLLLHRRARFFGPTFVMSALILPSVSLRRFIYRKYRRPNDGVATQKEDA